jgi:hypothetical protein
MPGPQGEAGPVGAQGERGLQGPTGERGVPGMLPRVKLWEDKVHYIGDVVVFDRSLFQAQQDTGQPPTHEDWLCLAAGGIDGKSPRVRGTFVSGAEYKTLDIVALGGGSFIARQDDPGTCPGDGWQSLTMPGKRGDKGPRGERGERGEPGARGEPGMAGSVIAAWELDAVNYRARAVMSDGSDGGTLDLREMFDRYHAEVGDG